ncbi:MAG: sulfatase-like hydrolase/transferase [Candidatus Limivivens sp.]|nr:sulfatase-like hydrolase/transferase [Candidatus Limivivens sp.]
MRKIFSKSKSRVAAAGAAAVLLVIFSFLAVQGEGLQLGNLALALFLSVLAGVLILADFQFWKPLSVIWYLLLPAQALCCIEFYTHVPTDLTVPIFILNYLFYLILYLCTFFLTGSMKAGGTLATLVPMLFGAANYFVVQFRSSPIVPWDFYSLGVAASVTDNYSFTFTYRLVFVLMGFVFIIIQAHKCSIRLKKLPVRICGLLISVLLMAGYITEIKKDAVGEFFGLDDILFTPNVLYRNNGIAGAFLSNLKYMDVEKPDGYSENAAREIADASIEENSGKSYTETDDQPNILVIMNEAFSDLRIYGDFATSEEVMPFIDSLEENTIKGNLYVSVKGGNTANTEFEFLTGNTMAFLPSGSVPYQQYIKSELPSLASHLSSLGYQTAALHPYRAQGWNRNTVYPALGFDETYFQSDFQNATTCRGYVDDQSAFRKLVELYEEKESDEKLFAFEVTMQNHGGYSKEYEDLFPDIKISAYDTEQQQTTSVKATEKYLTLIRKTDDAFRELLEYFENQEEKTIILMFGDHQPSDYICNPILRLFGEDSSIRESSVEEFRKGYTVPFILWANYDIPETEVEAISVNYLGGYLMQAAGLPMNGYQKYLDNLFEEYPVVTANFFGRSEDGTVVFREWNEDLEDSPIGAYRILQYNNLCDTKNRIQGFF